MTWVQGNILFKDATCEVQPGAGAADWVFTKGATYEVQPVTGCPGSKVPPRVQLMRRNL